jgi:hypothetical protein
MFRNRCAIALALGISLALPGCGGGGGGGASSNNQPATGQTATQAAAKTAVLYAAGQTVGVGATSPAAMQNGAPAGGFGVPIDVRVAELLAGRLQDLSRSSSSWSALGSTSYYYQIQSETSTSATLLLSTNGTSNNAGYISMTVTEGANGTYPIAANVNLHLVLPAGTVNGSDTITILDSSGDFNFKGSESCSTLGTSASYNLSYQSGQLTGTLSGTSGGNTVTFTNLVDSSSGFSANFSDGSVTGSINVNPDGSGSATATDGSGQWTLTWDSSLNYTLTSPSGKVTTGNLGS